jgi:predicted RNase H-like nuclease (RuvC/YqgF family)
MDPAVDQPPLRSSPAHGSTVQREMDALASMMGADSQRIDRLVDDVGHVKGRVERVDKNVDELRSAMAVLVRHEVVMEQNASSVSMLRVEVGELGRRVSAIETDMPQLRETRTWVVRGMLLVISLVGLAVVGLVVVRPGGG